MNKPELFTVGSIISNSNKDLPDTSHTFFLFRVTIGRAFCCKEREPPAQCPPEYDSVYMCPPDDSENVFSHNYYIYQSDRVSLHHKVVTKIKLEPSRQR